jgi:hypothetical protein
MSEPTLPPGMMFRSFLTVASAYVLTLILFFAIAYLLGLLMFPEFIAFFNLDLADQETMMAQNPQDAIPVMMFWILLALNVVACMGVGWLVAKTAPFAPFPHAIFLAVLLFANYMQVVIGDPEAKKWMDMLYMVAFPIAVLLGASRAMKSVYELESQHDELLEKDAEA